MAERVLSKAHGGAAKRQAEGACAFWRAVHGGVEAALEKALAPNRLAHTAGARTDAGGHFTRPPDTDLPEAFPDLPMAPPAVMLRKNGGRRG